MQWEKKKKKNIYINKFSTTHVPERGLAITEIVQINTQMIVIYQFIIIERESEGI